MLFGHRARPIFVLLLSQRFKFADFVFTQNSADLRAHRAKATQDDLRNFIPDCAVEKTSGSTAAVTKQNGTNSAHFRSNTCYGC